MRAKNYIYFNLHRKDWSRRQRGKVRSQLPIMTLTNVTFHVLENERQRAIQEGRRNVHAFCVVEDGDWMEGLPDDPKENVIGLRYNPFRGPHFTVGGRAVSHALRVYLFEDGTAFAAGVTYV